MRNISCYPVVLALLSTAIVALPAEARRPKQPRKPPPAAPVDATRTLAISPDKGYVTDSFTFDPAGTRLAFVNTDGATFSVVEVRDLKNEKAPVLRVDTTKFSLDIQSVHLPAAGDGIFVVGKRANRDGVVAAFLDQEGQTIRRWGPADAIELLRRDGQELVQVRISKTSRKVTVHEVGFYDLETGNRLALRRLVADSERRVADRNLVIESWLPAGKLSVRVPGGYDKELDQRVPDSYAVLDLLTDEVNVDTADILERARIDALRPTGNEARQFVAVSPDGRTLWHVDGDTRTELTLAEPLSHYKPGSLVFDKQGDTLFFTLEIDPVHPDAMAARRAVPETIDLYAVEPGSAAARLARVPRLHPKLGQREIAWTAGKGWWAVLYKHRSFTRGGALLEIFRLGPPAVRDESPGGS